MPETATRTMPRILCSSGAFAGPPNWQDEQRVLDHAPQLNADGLEIMIYGAWYDHMDALAERFRAMDVPILATHGEKNIGPDLVANGRENRDRAFERFALNCQFTKAIGADRCVLHLWGLPDADTLVDMQLEDLPRLLDIAEEHGVILAVEAIPCTVSDPLSTIRRVLETDQRARVAIDTEFLGMHDQLDAVFEADWLWNPMSVVHVHIKDFGGPLVDDNGKRRYLQPGEGTIDFPFWFSRLKATGYNAAITLEAPVSTPEGQVDVAKANRSIETIRAFVADVWRD